MLTRLPLVVILALAVVADPGAAQPRDVLVSAAVSLTEALQRIAPLYEAQSGEKVVLNLGASNILARQIRGGARVDVFVSADEAQMDLVAADIVPGTRVELLSNQLAIAVPDDRAGTIRSPRDLVDAAVRRVAIGDPAAVPAGVYAQRYLERAGLWTQLQPKLAPSGSVRLALAAVENGAADAAIVYATDLTIARGAVAAFSIPLDEAPRIVYPAALLKASRSAAEAKQWLAFLVGAQAAEIFRRHKFLPVTRR